MANDEGKDALESNDTAKDARPIPTSIHSYGPSQIFSPLGPVGQHSDQIRAAVRVLNSRYISLWQLGFLSAGMQLALFLLAPEQAIDGASTVARRIAASVQYWAPCCLAAMATAGLRRNRTVNFLDNLFTQLVDSEQRDRKNLDHTLAARIDGERRRHQRETDDLRAKITAVEMQLAASRAESDVYRRLVETGASPLSFRGSPLPLQRAHGGISPLQTPPKFNGAHAASSAQRLQTRPELGMVAEYSPMVTPQTVASELSTPANGGLANGGTPTAAETRSIFASTLESYFGSSEDAAAMFGSILQRSAGFGMNGGINGGGNGSPVSSRLSTASNVDATTLSEALKRIDSLEAQGSERRGAEEKHREEMGRLHQQFAAREAAIKAEMEQRTAEVVAKAQQSEAALAQHIERAASAAAVASVQRTLAGPPLPPLQPSSPVEPAHQNGESDGKGPGKLSPKDDAPRRVTFGDEEARRVVLSVVAETTGFFAEAIELDMELDSDLQIDSGGFFRRESLLREVQRQLGVEVHNHAKLMQAKTVGEVVDMMITEVADKPTTPRTSPSPSPKGSLTDVTRANRL